MHRRTGSTCAALLTGVLVLAGCRTVHEQLDVPGGTTSVASLETVDGAHINLWRWTPRREVGRKVLVLPELGFDHRLVTPLCERLRNVGFDVATVEGRDVSGQPGRFGGQAAWSIDIARALRAHGPRPIVIAVGVGGASLLPVASAETVRGIVAINVPLRRGTNNAALKVALRSDGYDPLVWLHHGIGRLLLADGHAASSETVWRLQHLAVHTTPPLREGTSQWLQQEGTEALPAVPARALVSVKDNLVASEDALPDGGIAFAHVRRFSPLEGFSGDFGHLDWLVDDARLAEASDAIIREIEELP